MLLSSNKNNEIILISIHNYPNNSNFSVSDLLIFTENPSIKLMQIVNKNGEVSFLFRPYMLDLKHIVIQNLMNIIPDISIRINEFQSINEEKDFSLSKIATRSEAKEIINESLKDLEKIGVFFSNYIDQDKANCLDFSFRIDKGNEDSVLELQNFSDFINKVEAIEEEEDDYEYGWDE